MDEILLSESEKNTARQDIQGKLDENDKKDKVIEQMQDMISAKQQEITKLTCTLEQANEENLAQLDIINDLNTMADELKNENEQRANE